MKYIRTMATLLVVSLAVCLQAQPLAKKNKGLPCVNKTYQINAHIILDSLGVAGYTPATLEENIVEANKAFAPICVDFAICSFDTITNYEFDSLPRRTESREVEKLFHLSKRINIYTPSFLMPGTGGFAEFCGVKGEDSGVVFLASTTPGTLIHELGHLFGLLHTFEGNGVELVSGVNCEEEGDLICDTPSDPFVPGEPLSEYVNLSNCEFISIKRDSMGQFYQPDVGNFMSYYNPCVCGFTRGQYIKMAESVILSDPKLW